MNVKKNQTTKQKPNKRSTNNNNNKPQKKPNKKKPQKPLNKLSFQEFHFGAKFLLSGNFKFLSLKVSLFINSLWCQNNLIFNKQISGFPQ